MKSKSFLWWACALIAVAPLGASTFMEMPMKSLVAASPMAVEAEVLSVSSFWNEEGTVIETEATVFVRDSAFGKSASVLKIRTFGGQVGDYRIEAIGFPTFEEGQRLFLFLKQDEHRPDMLRVTGYQQGMYSIETIDGVDQAIPVAGDGARFVTKDGLTSAAPGAMSLDELKQLVRGEFSKLQLNAADAPVN